MSCTQHCCGIQKLFDDSTAKKELERYRKKGPSKSTRLLLDVLQSRVSKGETLLDIGGGIGAIQHELLSQGLEHVVNADAAPAYQEAVRREAEKRNTSDRFTYHTGDFTELVEAIEPQDHVTLDKVICCYPDARNLLTLAALRAKSSLTLVYPKERWWIRLGSRMGNVFARWKYNGFQTYVHPDHLVGQLLSEAGFREVVHQSKFFWQVRLFERVD